MPVEAVEWVLEDLKELYEIGLWPESYEYSYFLGDQYRDHRLTYVIEEGFSVVMTRVEHLERAFGTKLYSFNAIENGYDIVRGSREPTLAEVYEKAIAKGLVPPEKGDTRSGCEVTTYTVEKAKEFRLQNLHKVLSNCLLHTLMKDTKALDPQVFGTTQSVIDFADELGQQNFKEMVDNLRVCLENACEYDVGELTVIKTCIKCVENLLYQVSDNDYDESTLTKWRSKTIYRWKK